MTGDTDRLALALPYGGNLARVAYALPRGFALRGSRFFPLWVVSSLGKWSTENHHVRKLLAVQVL